VNSVGVIRTEVLVDDLRHSCIVGIVEDEMDCCECKAPSVFAPGGIFPIPGGGDPCLVH
jgi:hypothetical protein